MRKALVLLLVFITSVFFTSCNKLPEENSSAVEATNSTFTSTYSDFDSSEETPASTEVENSAMQSTSSSNVNTTSSITTSPTGCTHPDYWEGHSGLHFIGGWYDKQPGIENKFTLTAKCEEERDVIYKCPICSEPVLVETLEPTGHDFSGEEEVLSYPTINSEGSWGIKCKSPLGCLETKITSTIPKRGGSYETVDSCFTINGNDYSIDNPKMSILDRRTWGDVPTIVFDTSTCTGTISYTQENGTACQIAISVDRALLDEGWSYIGTILESGGYDIRYSRWAWDGATSSNN